MNLDRFTTLAQQALADGQSVAVGRSHAELSPLHILTALLDDQTGIAGSVIGKVGVDAARVAEIARSEVDRLPTVAGEGAGPQTSPATIGVLTQAEKEAKQLGDAYVSTEHLLLALAEMKSGAKEVLSVSGLDRDRLLSAIKAVRAASGVQSIDDAAAESNFEALKKYAIDLNELAQAGKLDPALRP